MAGFRVKMRGARPISLLLMLVAPAIAPAQADPAGPVAPGVHFSEQAPATSDAAAIRIIDLYTKARGGDAFRDVSTLVLGGTVRDGLHEYTLLQYVAPGGRYRREVYREELGWRYLTVYATNGELAWKQEVLPHRKPAATLEDSEMAMVQPDWAASTRLPHWQESGLVLHYQGMASAAGEPAYIVRADEGGDVSTFYYFDRKRFLPRSIGYQEMILDRMVDLDHFPLRWQLVNGVRVETAYEVRNDGELLRTVNYDRVEVNTELDDSLFAMPEFREVWLKQVARGESTLEHRPDLPPKSDKEAPADDERGSNPEPQPSDVQH